MIASEGEDDSAELAKLMRSVAREEAHEVMDEHLEDYKHKPKKLLELGLLDIEADKP